MERITSSDGTAISLVRHGQPGAPTVVLVHGLGLSMSGWDVLVRRLARGHHVVAYDLRGHGRSGLAPSSSYSMRDHAADLDAVLEHVLPDGARVVAVGHSLGGAIILQYARDVGVARLAGAVFAASAGSAVTVPGLPGRTLPRWARRAARRGWAVTLLAAARVSRAARRFDPLVDAVARRLVFTPDDPAEAVRHAQHDFLSTEPHALAASTLASVSSDGTRLGPALRVPVLVLHGDRDREVGRSDVEELVHRLPDPELVTVPGGGHMLPLTDPETVAEHVARWVRRCLPAPPTDRRGGAHGQSSG